MQNYKGIEYPGYNTYGPEMNKKMRVGIIHIMNILNIAPKLYRKEWIRYDQNKIANKMYYEEEAYEQTRYGHHIFSAYWSFEEPFICWHNEELESYSQR